jgi:hypothetical protein
VLGFDAFLRFTEKEARVGIEPTLLASPSVTEKNDYFLDAY